MIKVEGINTTAAITRARHHLRKIEPLVLECAMSLLLGCPLARDEHVHRLTQIRTGAESYALILSNGDEFHFRSDHDDTVRVLDRYRHGKTVALLRTQEDVWNFFGALSLAEAEAEAA